MKSKHVTRTLPRLLAVVAAAALISPALPTNKVEAASESSQVQSPYVTFNGPATFNSSVFFGIFNFEHWFNTKLKTAEQPAPSEIKDDQEEKQPQESKEQVKQEKKEEQEQVKQEKKEEQEQVKQEKKEEQEQAKQEKKEEKQDKKEYDSIVKDATQQLIQLRNESKSELLKIALEAKKTKNPKERSRLYNLGASKFSEKEAEFNAIIQEVTDKLQANGFSTEIVDQYKAEFDQEVEAGKSLLKNLIK